MATQAIYQPLNIETYTEDEVLVLNRSDAPVPKRNCCCVKGFEAMQLVLGCAMLTFGTGSLIMAPWNLAKRTDAPSFGIFGIICGVFELLVGGFLCFISQRTIHRGLNPYERIGLAIASFLALTLSTLDVVSVARKFAYFVYHGFINTGVNGCYDACGPAIILAIITGIFLLPIVPVVILAIVVTVRSVVALFKTS